MLTKDKIILVYKIYIGQLDVCDVSQYIEEISKILGIKNDDSVLQYFIPTNKEYEHPIECINPSNLNNENIDRLISELELFKTNNTNK